METTKNLLNKKMSDLTVGESMKVTAVIPIVVIGGPVLIGLGYSYGNDVVAKVKELRKNHRKNKLKIVS